VPPKWAQPFAKRRETKTNKQTEKTSTDRPGNDRLAHDGFRAAISQRFRVGLLRYSLGLFSGAQRLAVHGDAKVL
jgi:hypothetical protein